MWLYIYIHILIRLKQLNKDIKLIDVYWEKSKAQINVSVNECDW